MAKFKLPNLQQYDKKNVYRWFIIIFVVLPAIPFILTTLGLLAYSFWPRDHSEVIDFTLEQPTEYLTLSAHGVKDSPASWSDNLQSLMSQYPAEQLKHFEQQHISLDWQAFSSNVFICSVAGKRIGVDIGKRIAKTTQITGIHVIGHSCGAFIAYGICQGIKSVNANILVQSTYLDPVSVYGGLFWNYGLDHFGSCADFSDSYIDREDGVPGSNQVLPHSVTFDITEIKHKEGYDVPPHVWPTIYYTQAYKDKNVPIMFNSNTSMASSYPTSPMLNIKK